MKKKSSLNESLNLALEILKRIPKSRYITVKELQSQLAEVGIERNIRTLQRIMETLSEQFNLDCNDKSKPYGYKLTQANAVLSLPTLSAQESLLFYLAREYLADLLPSRVFAAMDGFFHEADYQLNPTSPNQKERNWLKKVRVVSETQPLLAPHLDEEVLRIISQGLYEDRWLSLEYTNSKDEPKKAAVMPLGIAQQGNRLYLVCRFEGYTNERTLAIHRVTSAHLSTFTFDRPEDFDLAKYDADGRFGFGEGQQCRLQFCITKSEGYFLRETSLSPDQQVVERDDSLHISASVIDSLYLKKWLNSFGDNIWDIEIQPMSSVS